MTKTGNVALRIDMESFDGETRFAEYSRFSVGDEASEYVLHVAGYMPSSNAGRCVALFQNAYL